MRTILKMASQFSTLILHSETVLVRHSQAQKCLQINPKPFHQIFMKFLKFLIKRIFLLTDLLT